MRRKDRLYALMQRLRDGQLHTAEAMAQDLGVSVRTIYRDMETLAASGVPVEGARGYGYTAQAAVTLPPLNLTEGEVEALLMALDEPGASDTEQAEDARRLATKIAAVLPEDRESAAPFGFATDAFAQAAHGFAFMPAFRDAIRTRQKLRIIVDGTPHDIRPLHLDYWGRVWTCVAWNETTGDFLSLPLERIEALTPLPGLFVDEPGKRFSDWQARHQA